MRSYLRINFVFYALFLPYEIKLSINVQYNAFYYNCYRFNGIVRQIIEIKVGNKRKKVITPILNYMSDYIAKAGYLK